MSDLNKTLLKIQSHYVKYAEACEGDFLDIELPCRVADWIPFLLRTIEQLQKENKNKYFEGYKMAKFDCASELLNGENERKELIDQWYDVAMVNFKEELIKLKVGEKIIPNNKKENE